MGKVEDARLLAARIKSAARSPQEEHQAEEFARAVASREDFPQENNFEARVPDSRDRQSKPTSIEVEDSITDPPASPSEHTPAAQPPTAAPPRHALLGPDYHLEGTVAAVDCKAGEVKLTLSINSVLMKFHAADLKAVEVTPAANWPLPTSRLASRGEACTQKSLSSPCPPENSTANCARFISSDIRCGRQPRFAELPC